MSTRAGIIIKDQYSSFHFYKHSDGYPQSVLPTLRKYLSWIKQGILRKNAEQSAGWLILLGALDYGTIPSTKSGNTPRKRVDIEDINDPLNWKCGAFELTMDIEQHGDLKYRYIVDLDKLEIKVKEMELINGKEDFKLIEKINF